MEHHRGACLSAEPFVISGKSAQGLPGSFEKRVIAKSRVVQTPLVELLWDGKNDMIILHREEFFRAGLYP